MHSHPPSIRTLGELKTTGYRSRSVKEEMRDNLIRALGERRSVFEGIWGFEDTVIPELERAILARHNILLLGLRGQAKTRIARLMTGLLDEWVPVVDGAELQDDPLGPISVQAMEILSLHGDQTPVTWLHRSDRYVEKLATPDVSVADLIGDIDPIKAANERLSFSDERVIHFGLVPRAHRSIFVLNELPDLQPRIQVALFNILQEGDIQIRGFKKRLHLDIQFLFTANPEDYTNRGSIITPLKDRIDAQILTHYPVDPAVSRRITLQEARLAAGAKERITIPETVHAIVEQIAFESRESEYVDNRSGVSARMTISAYESLHSAVERRMLINGETMGTARINDLLAVIPAMTGKMELVYEGEQEGPKGVALHLMSRAIRKVFLDHFPNPESQVNDQERDPYGVILSWFSGGHTLDLAAGEAEPAFTAKLESVAGLARLAEGFGGEPDLRTLWMELALHGLAEFQQIGKSLLGTGIQFRDDLADALHELDEED